MAGSDNLNRVQFWPIEKAGQLRSGNFDDMTVEEEYQRRKAGDPMVRHMDTIRAGVRNMEGPSEYQDALTKHIAAHGLKNPPTFRDDGQGDTMTSGHHRYTSARDLGWKNMPIRPWAGGDNVTNTAVEGWD